MSAGVQDPTTSADQFGSSLFFSGSVSGSSGLAKRHKGLPENGGEDAGGEQKQLKSLQAKNGMLEQKGSIDSGYKATMYEDDGAYGFDDDADDDLSYKDRYPNMLSSTTALLLKEEAAADSISSARYGHDKKRQDRNFREKERTSKISKQIEDLKMLLDASGVKVKGSKYGVLTGASEYILRLQEQYEKMEREVKSMAEYTESKSVVARARVSEADAFFDESIDVLSVNKYMLLDASTMAYDTVFHSAPMPLGITTLEGKFLDCNDVFLSATRQPKETFLCYPLWEFIDEACRYDTMMRLDALYRLDAAAVSSAAPGVVSHVKSRIKFASDGSLLYFTIFVIRDEESKEPRFLSVFVTKGDPCNGGGAPQVNQQNLKK